uniref:Uncharacterized protein n=1 Tax=Knipowitschia caucasica TaxID=637954 RepID=A0AAV2M1W5_KNICA
MDGAKHSCSQPISTARTRPPSPLSRAIPPTLSPHLRRPHPLFIPVPTKHPPPCGGGALQRPLHPPARSAPPPDPDLHPGRSPPCTCRGHALPSTPHRPELPPFGITPPSHRHESTWCECGPAPRRLRLPPARRLLLPPPPGLLVPRSRHATPPRPAVSPPPPPLHPPPSASAPAPRDAPCESPYSPQLPLPPPPPEPLSSPTSPAPPLRRFQAGSPLSFRGPLARSLSPPPPSPPTRGGRRDVNLLHSPSMSCRM